MKEFTKGLVNNRFRFLFNEDSKIVSSLKTGLYNLISPYTCIVFVFLFVYIRSCTNDSTNDGNVYFNRQDYEKAIELYNEYLMLYPHHTKTLYNRGRCYEAMGKYSLAVNDYEQVLEKEPHNLSALLSMSQCYYMEENYEWAANLCDQAIMVDDQNYLAHYYKGRANHKIGNFRDALDGYNSAIDINPDFGFAYFQRSSLMLSIGYRPFGCYDLKIADTLQVEGAKEALLKYCR